jgi:hypothetical protein
VPDIRASHKIVPGEPQRGPLAGFRAGGTAPVSGGSSVCGFCATVRGARVAQTVDHDLIHFIGDRMISISGQAIDAGSHEEMGTSVLSRAKEFIDVALAITDMDAPPRILEKVRGLFQIFQPPNAFFLLDGNARLIDLSFEGGGSFEFLPRPEFDRCHSKREPFERNSETRMHQNSASRMRFGAAGEISSTVRDALRNADQLRPLSLIGELCCVVKHKYKTVSRHCAVAGRLKMTGKNVRLTDPGH